VLGHVRGLSNKSSMPLEFIQNSRILIVDDQEPNVLLLKRILERNGYRQFRTITDSTTVIEEFKTYQPDLLLLDLMMPKFSGFEVCQTLAALSFTQQIPIFIVSGEAAEKYKAFCQNLGAAGYFEKPVDFDQLKAALAASLTDKRAERRTEVRIRLNVSLKLRGKDRHGMPFDLLTTTENVSANGFLCSCTAALERDATLDVFLCREGEHHVGVARAVRAEWRDTAYPRYGFRFMKHPTEWVLQ